MDVFCRLEMLGALRLSFLTDARPTWNAWPTRKAGELIAFLALLPGQSGDRAETASALWPDADREAQRNRLKATVSLLRNIPESALLLPQQSDRTRLRLAPVRLDTVHYQELIKRADAVSTVQEGLPFLEAAAALFTGSFLAGWDNDWILAERAHWNLRHRVTLVRCAQAYAFLGENEAALSFARRAYALDNLDDTASETLLRLLAQSGRKAEALQTYRDFAARWQREIADPPPQRLQAMAQALLTGDHLSGATLLSPGGTVHDQPLASVTDQNIDDSLRLLSLLRREGVVEPGTITSAPEIALHRPDLLHALSRLSETMTVPEREALRRRHTAITVATVRDTIPHLRGAGAEGNLNRLDHLRGDISTTLRFLSETRPTEALQLATGLHWWWYVRGRNAAGQEHLEVLLERLPKEISKERADALLASGHFANCQGDNRTAFARYREARSLYEHLGDMDGIAETWMREGNASMEEGLLVRAYQLCQAAASHFRKQGDDPKLLMALHYAYMTADMAGLVERREHQFRDVVQIAESLHDVRYQALVVRDQVGYLIFGRDQNLSAAATGLSRGLELLSRQFDALAAIYTFQDAASLLAARKQTDEAATVLGIVAGVRECYHQPTPYHETIYPERWHLPESLALRGHGIRRVAKQRGRDLSISIPEALDFIRRLMDA